MTTRYYALRRLVPYRGTIHVADIGDAQAYTPDGVTWRVRWANPYGQMFSAGGNWVEASSFDNCPRGAELEAAIAARPPLPWKLADRLELWLLAGDGLPLALLQSRLTEEAPASFKDSMWRPFRVEESNFRADCLLPLDAARPAGAIPVPHRDQLQRQITVAAGWPGPAQWFRRGEDGGGVGLTGLHLAHQWEHRRLPASAFPALVLREDWPRQIERDLVRAYHEWVAAELLTHSDIDDERRAWLEEAACRRPHRLLALARLVPRFIDRPKVQAALVAATLARASGG